MRKPFLTLFLAGLACSSLWAQSQRTVLLEEFTQASCPPCAAQNPALNAMLANNKSKVVSIKYQTNWPGTDPMNVQTQSWVGPRVSYYDVQGVPDVEFNGTNLNIAPSSVTQSLIDDAYATPANFSITPTHSFSADLDSVFIKVVYTCTNNATADAFTLQVALTEETISFNTAPGTNGEKEFFNVMRRMYPDANGTSLKINWIAGEKDSVTFAAPIPAYVYNIWELGVVAFIQNNTKVIEQAAYSQPLMLPANAADALLAGTPVFGPVFCAPSLETAGITIGAGERSSTALTSCSIGYTIDNVAKPATAWTGSVAPGANTLFNLTGINLGALPVGGHRARFFVEAPNGASADLIPYNNSKSVSFYVASAPMAVPIQTNFTGATPANWGMLDIDGDAMGFKVSGGYCNIKFYDIGAGMVDELYLPAADLTGMDSVYLTFDIAAAQYSSAYNDKMAVQVSDDCGATWATVWEKVGAALATVPAKTSAYTPASANDFRLEWVDLDAYSDKPNVLVKFVGTSDYGNNAYLDNILLDGVVASTGISKTLASGMTVAPNPATGVASVSMTLGTATDVAVSLTDIAGKVVVNQATTRMAAGTGHITLDVSALPAGTYFVHVTLNGESMVKPLVVAH